MNKLNVIGVDLAKNVIQVSVLSHTNRELANRSLTRRKFAEFLGNQRRSLVAFEACAMAHHWARAAQRHGHEVKIIPARAVTPYRQGHKTDENDALAVAEAANRPSVKEAPLKTVDQQGLNVNLVGISRRVANKRLRAVLIQGARAYVHKMKEPKTAKDRWLAALIERSGHGKAAVALANKNVRTAWAMLTRGTEYRRYPVAA